MPKKTVPEAVEEMIKVREEDGTSDAYLKVLKVYLGQFKEKVQCQLTLVTTGMLTQYFRGLEVSPRSKNNARATIGAFFKFCKGSGWLPRDHEGVSQVVKFKESASEVIGGYSPEELMEILAAAREDMIPFLTIGAFAGLRTAEIERLGRGSFEGPVHRDQGRQGEDRQPAARADCGESCGMAGAAPTGT